MGTVMGLLSAFQPAGTVQVSHQKLDMNTADHTSYMDCWTNRRYIDIEPSEHSTGGLVDSEPFSFWSEEVWAADKKWQGRQALSDHWALHQYWSSWSETPRKIRDWTHIFVGSKHLYWMVQDSLFRMDSVPTPINNQLTNVILLKLWLPLAEGVCCI